MNVNKIIKVFEDEFAPVRDKFEIIKVLNGHKLDEEFIRNAKHDHNGENIIWYPGVYVFYGKQKVYKVGRHLTNSRLRVLQHIKDNTKNKDYQIADLKNFKDAEVILFNVIDRDDAHWVAAVEIFLEKKLNPLIPAKRQG